MKDHVSWMESCAEDSMECLLKTIEEITEDRDALSAGELDDLKDCWKTLKNIHKVKHHARMGGMAEDAEGAYAMRGMRHAAPQAMGAKV